MAVFYFDFTMHTHDIFGCSRPMGLWLWHRLIYVKSTALNWSKTQ